jgi:hypothetical protein
MKGWTEEGNVERQRQRQRQRQRHLGKGKCKALRLNTATVIYTRKMQPLWNAIAQAYGAERKMFSDSPMTKWVLLHCSVCLPAITVGSLY